MTPPIHSSLSPQQRDAAAANLLISPEDGWLLNYATMSFLAALIAGLGMRMDSAPVVIGAMLVAPVMRPVLGTGFACTSLVPRRAVARLVVVLAVTTVGLVGLGWLLTVIFPSTEVGLAGEVLARTAPDVRDLVVALAAGAAGAFATLRPKVAGSIPGVAIAVALVPPPVAAGIALGAGSMVQASGALLLYSTNLVAIIVGTVVTVLVLRVMGEQAFELNAGRLRTTAIAAAVAGLAIGVPLYSSFDRAVTEARAERDEASSAARRSQLESKATTQLQEWIADSRQPNLGVVSVSVPLRGPDAEPDDPHTVSVVLLGGPYGYIPPMTDLSERLSEALESPVVVTVRLVGVSDQASSLIGSDVDGSADDRRALAASLRAAIGEWVGDTPYRILDLSIDPDGRPFVNVAVAGDAPDPVALSLALAKRLDPVPEFDLVIGDLQVGGSPAVRSTEPAEVASEVASGARLQDEPPVVPVPVSVAIDDGRSVEVASACIGDDGVQVAMADSSMEMAVSEQRVTVTATVADDGVIVTNTAGAEGEGDGGASQGTELSTTTERVTVNEVGSDQVDTIYSARFDTSDLGIGLVEITVSGELTSC